MPSKKLTPSVVRGLGEDAGGCQLRRPAAAMAMAIENAASAVPVGTLIAGAPCMGQASTVTVGCLTIPSGRRWLAYDPPMP